MGILRALIEHGADVDATNSKKCTALHVVVDFNQFATVGMLGPYRSSGCRRLDTSSFCRHQSESRIGDHAHEARCVCQRPEHPPRNTLFGLIDSVGTSNTQEVALSTQKRSGIVLRGRHCFRRQCLCRTVSVWEGVFQALRRQWGAVGLGGNLQSFRKGQAHCFETWLKSIAVLVVYAVKHC